MCKYCEKQVIKKSNVISNIDGSDNGLIDPPPMFECQINELLKSDFEQNKDYEDYFIEHPASMIVESPKRLNKLMNPDDVESSIYIKIDILYCPFCGRKLGISPKDFLDWFWYSYFSLVLPYCNEDVDTDSPMVTLSTCDLDYGLHSNRRLLLSGFLDEYDEQIVVH